MAPTGPFRLVTVNTAPERAKRLIGRVVEDVKDQYTIIHIANAASEFSLSFSPGDHRGRADRPLRRFDAQA
jgi:hypothetical protein